MALNQLPSGPEILLIEYDFPSAPPDKVFAYWTEPTLLQRWWSPSAEIELHEGGVYHLSWPEMNWHLRGRLNFLEPGKRLAFTWRWEHDTKECWRKAG
jgi:uncharacterized protein YndB with AHSA1/START domain